MQSNSTIIITQPPGKSIEQVINVQAKWKKEEGQAGWASY
jgi:hypothetical protein